ncbi:MAG: aminopeptidase P family protein [Nitrososphaeraceae archaeon]|nr:aminopeptidase P family protein [Nitrososphaeraceae archaeon]
MFINRKKKLLERISKFRCNSLLVFQPENMYYLTGFWGEGAVVIDENNTKLLSPKLEYARAIRDSKNCEVIQTERGKDILTRISSNLKENLSLTDCEDNNTLEYLGDKVGKDKLIVNNDVFFKSRAIKDKTEIQNICNAAKIIDFLFNVCLDEIKIGLSERELHSRLVYEALRKKAMLPFYKSTLFPFIIAGGRNGALPHSDITDRRFKNGDFIVVDITLRYKGYVADATRTFGLGNINKEMRKVYDIVRNSQDLGIKKAGTKPLAGEIDKICRDFISNSGYSEQFNHSTGHGIGLAVHEPPWIRQNNNDKIENQMSITIEPGVYFESKFGVRIEDTIVIDENSRKGIKIATKFSKDLIMLGKN